MVQYHLVWILLVLELGLFALLTLPIPLRWKNGSLLWVRQHPLYPRLKYALRVVFIFILLLFAGTPCG